MAARIHEGICWSNRDRRTLLDKLGSLILELQWSEPVIVVADAYYTAAKFARTLLDKGHHLVTRVRITAVAHFPAPSPRAKRRGRRKIYGPNTKLRRWFRYRKQFFIKAPSPVYGEKGVTLRYYSFDLLWRQLGRVVRFVWVDHSTRGQMVLLCTDVTLEPLEILRLYGWRFKTAAPQKPPSEWVVSHALRYTWPQFLEGSAQSLTLKKFLAFKIDPRFCAYSDAFNLDKAA